MKFLSPNDYQERNLSQYRDLSKLILKKLPSARIEHIGASAVPGAHSKGDLDIFVGVAATDHEASIQVIQNLGFREKIDTLRTPELCMLELEGSELDVAVQLVSNGSKFESFITFRDALIQSPELLSSYNELKESCAGMDHENYRREKSKFIEAVLDAH